MDCPRPIRSVLYRFYATWSSRTRPSTKVRGPGVEARKLVALSTYMLILLEWGLVCEISMETTIVGVSMEMVLSP